MNIKQLKWIFKKALMLIEAYENKQLTDNDCQNIIAYAEKVFSDSKENEYCKRMMLDVVAAFNKADHERMKTSEQKQSK